MTTPSVLVVGVHNAGRSRMAVRRIRDDIRTRVEALVAELVG